MRKLLVPLVVGGAVLGGAIAGATFAGAASSNNKSSYAEDRAEIQNLQARYLFALDWGDADTYASTFAPNGELDYAGGVEKGRKAIHELDSKVSRDDDESGRAFKTAPLRNPPQHYEHGDQG